MKTTEKTTERKSDVRKIGYLGKASLIVAVVMCSMNVQAQKANQVITISGAQFVSPLIEKWTSEYIKTNPDVTFKFVKSSSKNEATDLKLTVSSLVKNGIEQSQGLINVGRLAVLPVANEKNKLFAKQLKNGIKQDELKTIFLQSESDAENEIPEDEPKEPLYTVYTQPVQSQTAQVLIDHFGKPSSELNGVIVTGDDKYLIESVREDSTGVTYSNLGLIYDLNRRTPLSGIKILPIDPDNNGRLKKEELIYDNLDQLISFLESNQVKTIPTDKLSFSYNSKNTNPQVADFVSWVTISGQQFNRQFGFLRTGEDKERALSQK